MTETHRGMARGAAWLILLRLAERGIGIVSTLILARLLVPADFGLVAMATSILAALDLLGAFSFDMALIQNQNAQRHHYDTAWTFAVLFGMTKALLLCLLAVPAAGFYNEPRLQWLIYALAVYALIEGFDNIGIVAFQKDLQLHKEFRFGLTKKLVGFVVTLTLAFWLRSYWALMAGILSTRVASLILSYRMHPYRPRLCWTGAGDLFRFSRWLLLNSVLIFLNNRGADFLIGKLAGARALGLYSVSFEIANLPTTELVWPISRAVFPGYARMAHDLAQLRATFVQVIGLVVLLVVPAGVLIALVAEPLVLLLLGSQWADAVPLIQVLAMFGVVRAVHGPTGSIYLALGRPAFVAGFQSVQLVVAGFGMLILIPQLGVVGAAWALLAGALMAMVTNFAMLLRQLQLPISALLGVLWRPLAGVLAMAAAVNAVGIKPWSGTDGVVSAIGRLVVPGGLALAVYLLVVSTCWWLMRMPAGPESLVIRLSTRRFRTWAA